MASNQPLVKSINEIRFEGVTFSHEGHDPTLKNVDFTFPTENVVWFKSPEGAGKSTLLQILAGLVIPQSGNYYLNDDRVNEMSFEDFLPYRLAIGYTFDYGGLINNRTIQDNLLLPLLYHKLVSDAEAQQRVDELIKRFDLEKFRHERPAHIPGRVRKLGCLLRALIIHPQMLLMDDPSVGLGKETAETFVEVINELRDQGHIKHMFVSSYDEKFMSLFDYSIVHIDEAQLYYHKEEHKRVVSL